MSKDLVLREVGKKGVLVLVSGPVLFSSLWLMQDFMKDAFLAFAPTPAALHEIVELGEAQALRQRQQRQSQQQRRLSLSEGGSIRSQDGSQNAASAEDPRTSSTSTAGTSTPSKGPSSAPSSATQSDSRPEYSAAASAGAGPLSPTPGSSSSSSSNNVLQTVSHVQKHVNSSWISWRAYFLKPMLVPYEHVYLFVLGIPRFGTTPTAYIPTMFISVGLSVQSPLRAYYTSTQPRYDTLKSVLYTVPQSITSIVLLVVGMWCSFRVALLDQRHNEYDAEKFANASANALGAFQGQDPTPELGEAADNRPEPAAAATASPMAKRDAATTTTTGGEHEEKEVDDAEEVKEEDLSTIIESLLFTPDSPSNAANAGVTETGGDDGGGDGNDGLLNSTGGSANSASQGQLKSSATSSKGKTAPGATRTVSAKRNVDEIGHGPNVVKDTIASMVPSASSPPAGSSSSSSVATTEGLRSANGATEGTHAVTETGGGYGYGEDDSSFDRFCSSCLRRWNKLRYMYTHRMRMHFYLLTMSGAALTSWGSTASLITTALDSTGDGYAVHTLPGTPAAAKAKEAPGYAASLTGWFSERVAATAASTSSLWAFVWEFGPTISHTLGMVAYVHVLIAEVNRRQLNFTTLPGTVPPPGPASTAPSAPAPAATPMRRSQKQ